MIFLEEKDFDMLIKQDILDKIAANDRQLVRKAELAALQEAESYLRNRFEVAAIWQKKGEDRNALLVMYITDMLLYHIHSRTNPRQMPEIRAIRYDAAIDWLKAVAKAAISPDLPLLLTPDQGSKFRAGYETRRKE